MRKNTKRLIALLMTITMILAVCPVEIFAAGDDTAVSTVPAAVTDSADTAEDTPATEEASASEDTTISESEAPVSAEQSEAAASQQTNANAAALQKSSGLLPAPVFQKYYRGSVAASYITTAVFEGEGTAEQPYLITSSADWDALSSAINSGSTAYAGKYFKLTDDITVTRGIGSGIITSATAPVYPFSGTFDGCGHTLNFVPPADTEANYVAPFSIVKNATVTNLKVTGKVTAYNNISGLVGSLIGTLLIENVISDVDVSGNFVGGFIGHGSAGNITVRNSAYTGDLNGSTLAGGIICWRGPTAWDPSGVSAVHMENCLFAGRAIGTADFHPIGFTQQTNVPSGFTNMWSSVSPKNNSKGFYNYQYQGASYKPTVAVVTSKSDTSGTRPWMGYYDVTAFPPIEGALAEALNAWTGAEKLFLLGDVTTNSTITVPTGSHTLDLNGYGILITGNSRVITINKDASLKLNDSNPDRIHYITLTDYRGTAVSDSGESSVSNGNGIIQVKGGYLTGGYLNNTGSHDKCGAGVFNWGTFVMNGGNIVGNTMLNNSGAGIRNSGFFTMNSGKIAFNKATANGGGVTTYVPGGSQGKMTMNAGEISDNYCGKYGGGIQLAGPFELTGGAIVRNTADMGGSGIYYSGKGDRFKISGEPIIKDNLNDNLFLDTDATFMISGSLAEDAEIGILMKNNAVFTVGWKDNMGAADPSECFTSDNSNYAVILNSSGEAGIGVPPAARIISGEVTTNYGSISDAVGAWTAGSTLKLLSDVTTGSTITVPSGEHTLDLNGHELKRTGATGSDNSGLVITVGDGVNLTVTGPGKITGGSGFHGGGIHVEGNSSLVLDNCEISGNTGHYGGGLYLKNGTITLKNGTAVKNNSATEGFGGSGIYAEGSGTLILEGGTFTNNEIRNNNQYAVFLAGNANAQISGAPVIYDNKYGSTQKNLYMFQAGNQHSIVRIAGALTDGAKIGVGQTTLTGEITSGWKDKMGNANPSKYFTSDNNSYSVFLNANNEAEIGVPPAARIISGEVTTNYGSISDAVGAWTAGSTLKLLSDVTTGSTITVPAGSHTLDLNGHTLKAGSAGYSVITVGSGAELVIDDTAGGGKITGGSVGQNYGGGITVDAGTLTLRGGAVSGNANTYGAIGYCSGGVLVKNSGKFYMEGGEISANTSYVGGGVCSDGSATTVSITGGVIKNNTTERFASAIWAGRTDNATFLIGGTAEIVGNISKWTSDKNGEASVNFSKLSISGNPTVRGCWKTTGNSAPNAHINLDNNGSSVQRIALDGALTNESGTPNLLFSPIYRWNDLQSGKTFVFTENWSTYMGTAHPADYFGVDASVSGVRIIRKDGEAAFTGSSDLGDLYITYNANGGTGEMDAQLVSTTSAVLNQNLFTNGNKEFIGWNTKADGSGTPYGDKGDITLSGDVTLYAQWAEKHAHDDIDFKIWTSTTSLPTKAGDYYLGADVTISSTWNVPSGTVNLCLDGHGIKMVGSGSVINVGSSAVLNVYDCGETEHKFTVNSPASNGAGCAIVNDSLAGDYKTFTGGYITGGNARNGGGIKVNGTANLTLNGGTIIGNQSSFMGAGIKADNNGDNTNINITVNGGAIIYNTVNGYGAGICSDGAVRVNGGTIAYNYATKDPGGIHCHYLYMSGGSIVNNYADDNEYAAGVHADHEVFISGNPVISDNVYKGTPYNLDWDRTELAHGHKLNITGALTEGAQIGVTLKIGGAGVFTNGWKANMGDADPTKYFTSDNADYTVIRKDGEAALEYPPVPDVSASGYTGDYDGAAHGIAVSVPTGATVQYGTKEGEYSLTENPSYTGAGIYNVYYKVTMDKHTPVEGSAVVTINQIDVTVTITGHNTTVNYDGKAHSADGYDFAADTALYTAVDFTFSGRAEAVRTDAGTTQMGLAASQFANTNDNFDTVTFNVTDGFVKINPIDVTVTITGHTVTANYDGKAHSVEGYDFAADSTLYTEADFTFSGSAAAERTDAGTTQMGLAASQFANTNENFATVTFNVTDGFVKINPIDVTVTITGHTVTSDYDGKAHSVEGYDFAADSTLYTEADFTFSGTAAAQRTDAGKTDMGLTAAQFENTNENFATVTFHVTDGFVKIDPIDVTVTITGHRTTVDFNAETHSADGYDFAADNALYTEADFTFDGRAEALRTNAGTTYMGLTASQFKNTNKNFATVVFDVTDGFVKVNQINAVVTITGQYLTADYDGNTHSVAGYEFESDTPLYTAAYVTFSGNAAAERREAGTTQMGLAAAQFKNTNENFATVTFHVKDGYVTINPITAVVTVTGHTNTAPYNGKAHTVSGYDASANTALYDVEKDFAFTGSANAVQTDVGTAKMGLSSAQFKNTNPNFASVIFKVTDGWQKITRVDASIKSAPHAKNNLVYSGDTQALIVPGTAVGGTLYYAIGANDTTVPAGAQFKQTLPAAKEVGNYYIWYKVAADKNHNSLAPKCFKVTLAEPAWETISGKILNNDNTPAPGAKVILMRGNEVVDTITSNENGEYYFTVPKGVYNMVVKVNGVTVTNIADVTGNVNSLITLPAPNTDSVLDIVSSDKSIAVGGLEQEASLIRKSENIPDDVNVTVKMTVQAIAESDTDGSKAITSFAKDKYIEFYNLSVEKTVGSVTTKMNTTQTVMEIVIPCSFTNKRELQVFTCDGGDVTALTESDSGEPGTYRVDTENGLIYIYTTSFATVALAYQPYFSVTSLLSLGSYTGKVSVKLEKESGDKIFELNDVSVEDIAFKGVPRGTYTMTVQWVDGAENTITMPFNIK